MSTVAERVAFFNVVTCPTTPIAHLAVVLAPSMYGMVANSDLSLLSSLTLKVGSLVHVTVNAAMDTSNGVSSS